jgi:hypothetical protein
MSFPSSGVYKVKNVETGTYLSVEGESTEVGAAIVGYRNSGGAGSLVLALRLL